MDKVKVTEIAQELGITSKEILAKAKDIGIVIKSVNSSVLTDEASAIYEYIATGKIPTLTPQKEAKKSSTKKTKDSAKDSTKDSAKDKDSKDSAKKGAKAKTTKDSAKDSKDSIKDSTKDSATKAKKSAKDSAPKATKKSSATKKATKDSSDSPDDFAQDSAKDSAKDSAHDSIKKDSPKDSPKIAQESPLQNKIPKHIEPRKIIIVSKNNAPSSQKTKSEKLAQALDIKDKILHPDFSNEDTPKLKNKKDKKKEAAKKIHTNEQKIDLNRNLGDTELDDENEIMLVDFSESSAPNSTREENQRISDNVRIQRANPWFFDSVSRERKKRRGGYKRDNSHNHSANNAQKNTSITIPDEIRVYEFADKVGVKITDIIATLFKMGEMVTKNDFLDSTMIEILASEFDLTIETTKAQDELEYLEVSDKSDGIAHTRAPVVTIMGHVDHGKTSLLDYIRQSRVSKTESGGITQHIGAYMVEKNGKAITFIDTPGHEAFATMRARGAQVTDIAIIVIAADDGVKEQTKEALSHAKDSKVQMIIAMNKMDKEGANPDKLKTEMAELGYMPSDWGGTLDFVPVSAKSGAGIDELLDTILIQAELMELKATHDAQPKAVILEGSLDKGKGPVVTAIVQEGILRVGDAIVADTAYGKIRAIIKDNGAMANALYPSEVALLTGLNEVPSAGAILVGLDSESRAKEYAMKRKAYLRTKELSRSTKVSFDELSSVVASARLKPLHLIIKADTQGSLEAIKASLEVLSNDEIKVNIIASNVGNITESDIDIAQNAQSDCYILGFNVKPLGKIKSKAKELAVAIKSYSVIYDLVNEVKGIIAQMMRPIISEEIIGNIEVRDIFTVGKGSVIAGCFVIDGIIHRNDKVRLMRGEKVLHQGNIASLKRFKDDVKEVGKGYECGIMLDSFNDIKVGDSFEVIKETYKPQSAK